MRLEKLKYGYFSFKHYNYPHWKLKMKNRIKHPKHIRIIPKPFNYSFTLMFE